MGKPWFMREADKRIESEGNLYNAAKGMFLTPEEQEGMISDLLRSLGTTTAQGYNRAEEMGAQYNLPLATQMSQKAGVGYRGQEAGQKGITEIERYAKDVNRQGSNQLFQAELQKKLMEIANERSFGEQLLGVISGAGQAAGYGYGYGLAG